LVCPIVCSYTDTSFAPGFVNPLDDARVLTCGLIFLGVDIFEWVTLTFGILYARARNPHTKVALYRNMLLKDKQVLTLVIICAVTLGLFM
jgi:hypothetical protein